jgi:PAS domain S-box-containing protein
MTLRARLREGRPAEGSTKQPLAERVLLSLALSSLPEHALYLLDPQGQIISWNVGAERLLGYTATEAIGENAAFFFEEQALQQEKTERLLNSVTRQGQVKEEAFHRRKDGQYFWAETLSWALQDEHGTLAGYAVLMQDITSRKATEENLQESEWHFKLLVNKAPVFIWVSDLGARVTYANETWQRFIGTSFEGALGHAYRQFVHPNDLPSTLSIYERALVKRQPYELECRMRRSDEDYRWIHYSAVPQYTKNGEFEGFIGVGMDVTERKNMEQALAESEIRFRALTDDIPVVIWMADSETRIVHVNKACCEFFGKTLAETVGQVSVIVAHPDDIDSVKSTYSLAVQERKAYSLECRVQRWDGEYRWMLYRGVPRFLPDGEFLGFIGIGVDITERKQAELAMLESETRFRTLADASPILIWLNDEAGNLIYANKGLLDFFGQSFELISQRGWEPYIYPDDLALLSTTLAQAQDEHAAFDCEFRMKRADGEYRWLLSRGAPRYQEDGTFLGLIGTSVDITEIRQAREELERKVGERTAQLEAINKEMEAFAYSVSHDLRAPLRSIDGFSRLLLNKTKDKLSEGEQRNLMNVCENTQRMGELIDDLLKLSRLSRAEMVTETVDLGAIAKAILESHQKEEPERKVKYRIADHLLVQGDAPLLKVLLENLLGNAWKFTRKKAEARIEVGMQQVEGKPVFYVKDNGAGFNMRYADKLFGAFQRLHRMDEFPGTGIGLATVQRIMHRHGGNAWAEGIVDEGATFYFSFKELQP